MIVIIIVIIIIIIMIIKVNRQMLQETCLGSYDFGVDENTIFRKRLRLPR